MDTQSAQIIPNKTDPSKPFIFINFHNSIKLTPTNYITWKTQIQAILFGHDLIHFIDGSQPPPSPTLSSSDSTSPNPAFQSWQRQDKLIFGALLGTLSPTIAPLVSQASSTQEAWHILAHTYANHSRGHYLQIKDRLDSIQKHSNTVSDYMHSIKSCVDELSIMSKPMDNEDVIAKVLKGLPYDDYKPIIDVVRAHDSPISFEALHEKLINHEINLKHQSPTPPLHGPSPFPASAHVVHTRPSSTSSRHKGSSPTPLLLELLVHS